MAALAPNTVSANDQEAEALLANDDWALLRAMLREADAAQLQHYVERLSQPGALTAALNWYRANVRAGMVGQTALRDGGLVQCPVMGVWGNQGVCAWGVSTHGAVETCRARRQCADRGADDGQ